VTHQIKTELLNKLLGELLAEKKKKCPICGRELLPHWKYCPEDGEKI